MNLKKISYLNIKQLSYLLMFSILPVGTSYASGFFEEIIVTAQKREQSLQDVPLAVSAITGEQLDSLNRNEISDLGKSIPGFTFKTGTSDADKAIQIRGVGTATFSRGVEQSVGTVIDGVVASSVVAGLLDFADVDRIEVLRGPQGMLFGKNASAGLLNIATIDPTSELSYGGRVSIADEGEVKLNGYLSGGNDTVAGRISFYSTEQDGIIENLHPTGPDYNNRNEEGVRAKLLIEPSEDLSVLLSYVSAERDYICCATPTRNYLNPFFSAILPTGDENDQIFESLESELVTDVNVYSAEINYQLGDHTLTSITSQTDTEIVGNFLGVGLPFALVPINRGDDDISQFTQEIRITSPADQKVSYVAGVYYYKNELDRTFTRVLDLTNFFGIYQTLSNDAQVEKESFALFGQATWNISDRSRLSLGLRYNDEEISVSQQVGSPPLPFPNTLGAPVFPEAFPFSLTESESDTDLSWRIIAERDLSDDKMIYASVARGYKGLGANTLATLNADRIVDPEIPTNYELGLKSEWRDGTVRLNASLFHTEFKDFQASLTDGNVPAQFFLDNAGKLVTEGLEVELSAQLSDNVFVSTAIASIDAEFDEYLGAGCYPGQTVAQGCIGGAQNLSGKELPYSPDLTVSLFTRIDIPLESMPFNAYVQGSYFWQDEVQYQTNNDPDTISDSYGIADFSIGVESNDGNLSAQLFVKNAFDEFYVTNLTRAGAGLGIGLQHSLDYAYTRRVGVAFKADF